MVPRQVNGPIPDQPGRRFLWKEIHERAHLWPAGLQKTGPAENSAPKPRSTQSIHATYLYIGALSRHYSLGFDQNRPVGPQISLVKPFYIKLYAIFPRQISPINRLRVRCPACPDAPQTIEIAVNRNVRLQRRRCLTLSPPGFLENYKNSIASVRSSKAQSLFCRIRDLYGLLPQIQKLS